MLMRPEVGEGLGEVAQQAPVADVVALRQQADVVAHGQHPFEQRLGLRPAAQQDEGVGQPEGAQQEGPFARAASRPPRESVW